MQAIGIFFIPAVCFIYHNPLIKTLCTIECEQIKRSWTDKIHVFSKSTRVHQLLSLLLRQQQHSSINMTLYQAIILGTSVLALLLP